MEIMSGFRSIKKPVITEISTVLLATITITDILFLTKMQKKGKPSKRFSLVITRKCNLAKFGYGGDMLKNL
jgi:hypothetical protein